MNDLLTASRMNSLLRCPRAHYWNNEVGLVREDSALALRFGSAWHAAMEARWNGLAYDAALASALPEGIDLDPYDCATLGGLLAGYYRYYGETEVFGKLYPEEKFEYRLDDSRSFRVAGKIDGLGILQDDRTGLIESKTTSDSVSPDSEFWLRLRFNMQVLQYVHAARTLGWDISVAIYDVTKKPGIKPKQVVDLDEAGKKIVLDAQGQRVFKANGEPRESGSEKDNWTVSSHIETPDEYCNRLIEDIASRPDYYFARREVPIIEDELAEFVEQRLTLSRMILHMRQSEKRMAKPEQAWPRAVSENNCHFCSYSSFCLQNISIDLDRLPTGFSVNKFNPELEEKGEENESATDSAI